MFVRECREADGGGGVVSPTRLADRARSGYHPGGVTGGGWWPREVGGLGLVVAGVARWVRRRGGGGSGTLIVVTDVVELVRHTLLRATVPLARALATAPTTSEVATIRTRSFFIILALIS